MILCEDIKFVILSEFVVGSEDRKNIVRSVELVFQNLRLKDYK